MTDMTPTTSFIQTLSQTPSLATQLRDSLQQLQSDLDELIETLENTQTAANRLNELEEALETTSELLSFAKIVPGIGESVVAVEEVVDQLAEQLEEASDAADELEQIVRPLREALQELGPVLDEMINITESIRSTSQNFLDEFTAVVDCVASLPAGDDKQQAEDYLNEFSSNSEPYVADLNQMLEAANDAISTFYRELTEIEGALAPLFEIVSAAEDLVSTLSPLIDTLRQLKQSLEDTEIVITLGYPLTLSLYDIITNFSELIDFATGPIEALIGPALEALDIELPSIPGLEDLIDMDLDIPAIPDVSEYLESITDPFGEFEEQVTEFTLECPPQG